MRKALLDILVDPISKEALQIEGCQEDAENNIFEGTLIAPNESRYSIVDGIPRFVITDDCDQKQTEASFGYKWQQTSTYDTPAVQAQAKQWLVQRYGFQTADEMRGFFSERQRILDAGCGSGFSSSLWMNQMWQGQGNAEWFGADISVAIDVAQDRLNSIPGTHFIQADVLQLPFEANSFDTIFSEGVLHHTPSTELALKSLAALLKPDGEIMFYVYRKKGAIREFTDDYIRNIISPLSPEEAWDTLRPLTKLGQSLAELKTEVEIVEDIPCLDIKAGNYDVQRLIYWNFAKCFWDETYSFEQNHHVNFDWYHPCYAHRQTEEEVYRWCNEAGLSINHFAAQESGFTVRAIKK